ncbi:MAG: DUF1641 domain-containing protein [Thermaerobacter sp.]|jgi:uncharacterized protein YjgD (DUF1641 family)|nr:DUF1641 domain-containing protein [Thermaerobacter sp.]
MAERAPENESLNNLLSKARELDELATVAKALQDGTTSQMVERVVGLGERLLEAADLLARPGMLELLRELSGAARGLTELLQTLRMLQDTGTLEALTQLALLAGAFKNSATDAMATRVAGLAASGLELADQAVSSGAGHMLAGLGRASGEALAEAERDPRPVTLWGLRGQLRDPQVQKGVKLLLALTRRLPGILGAS